MALTTSQKKWAVGGAIGGGALIVGYLFFHGRRAHAGSRALPGHADHHHGKHHHHGGDASEGDRDNERGEYGQKRKHHHGDHGNG